MSSFEDTLYMYSIFSQFYAYIIVGLISVSVITPLSKVVPGFFLFPN